MSYGFDEKPCIGAPGPGDPGGSGKLVAPAAHCGRGGGAAADEAFLLDPGCPGRPRGGGLATLRGGGLLPKKLPSYWGLGRVSSAVTGRGNRGRMRMSGPFFFFACSPLPLNWSHRSAKGFFSHSNAIAAQQPAWSRPAAFFQPRCSEDRKVMVVGFFSLPRDRSCRPAALELVAFSQPCAWCLVLTRSNGRGCGSWCWRSSGTRSWRPPAPTSAVDSRSAGDGFVFADKGSKLGFAVCYLCQSVGTSNGTVMNGTASAHVCAHVRVRVRVRVCTHVLAFACLCLCGNL